MAKPLEAPMPRIDLDNGCKIALEARDAATGALVNGVVITDIAIYGVDLGDNLGTEAAGPFMWLPGPPAVPV